MRRGLESQKTHLRPRLFHLERQPEPAQHSHVSQRRLAPAVQHRRRVAAQHLGPDQRLRETRQLSTDSLQGRAGRLRRAPACVRTAQGASRRRGPVRRGEEKAAAEIPAADRRDHVRDGRGDPGHPQRHRQAIFLRRSHPLSLARSGRGLGRADCRRHCGPRRGSKRRRHNSGPGRRIARRFVGVQRRSRRPRDICMRNAHRFGGGPRNRFHDSRLRRRHARAHSQRGRRTGRQGEGVDHLGNRPAPREPRPLGRDFPDGFRASA